MTIGRTDDPENPISVPAFEAAKLFGTGSRTPSGPADMVPRQQAGHMLAFDTPVRILLETLASEGPSTHARRNTREVRANLAYRDFTRLGAAKMPDAKTMGRRGMATGPTVIHQIHDRIVQIARAHDVVPGRRMRVDTTVVENNIH